MEELYVVQLDNIKSLRKATVNFKKSPLARRTKPYVQVRVQNLDKQWEIFQETHREIVKSATQEQRNSHEYFKGDLYDIASEEYLETKIEMISLLEESQPQSDRSEHATLRNENIESQSIRPQCQEVKLPKINIPQFYGNYNDWGTFKDLYTSLIHNQSSLSPVQKLHYLKSCLTGEAEQLLKHIQITEKNYEVAWTTLQNRYNNKRIVVNTILNRLLGQKKLSFESAKGVKELLDTTTECLNSLKNNDITIANWDPIIIHVMVNKLDSESHKQWEENLKTLSVEELPTLERFSTFLEGRFRVLEMIQTAHPKDKPQIKSKSFHVTAPPNSNSTADVSQQCSFCNEEHFIYNCKEFSKLDPEKRSQEVQTLGLCFNCLKPGHSVRFCRRNTSCLRCKRKHHTLLHVTKPRPEKQEATSEKEDNENSKPPINIVSHCASQKQVTLLATALVNIMTNRGAQVVRALIDPCSQESFITEETARKLQLKRTTVDGQVTGVGKMSTPIKHAAEIQIVSRINENYKLNCTAYVINQVTEIMPVTKIDSKQWTQLHGLELADPTYCNPGKIDLLLGVNVYTDILMSGIIKGKPGSPLAQETSFGWIISGGAPAQEYGKNGRIVSMHLNVSLDNMLQRFWESETLDTESRHMLTPLEERAEQIYKKTLARDQDGRFIVGLPFARDTPILPDQSRAIAVKRLECLERKLAHNSKLKEEYDNVIKEYLTLNHMEQVDKPTGVRNTVYLPHHAVIREDKETSKVRVVFDASCKGSNGVSLNDELLVGPALQEELRDIIMRWRQHKVCFVADIIKMYRQIKVRETDADYQRIVYRFSPDEEIQDFRLLTVSFGTASAPYLAIRTLKQLAKEEKDTYPVASEIINRDFYMDDVLTGFDSEQAALEAHEQLQQVMGKGCFELQKIASNSTELMLAIPPEKRDNSTTLDTNRKNYIKTLGIIWYIDKDNLKVAQKDINTEINKPVTKRNILGQIASLFDPHGWLAPALMTAKMFMQRLWLAHVDWDQELPADLKEEWLKYQEELPVLSEIQLQRWTGSSEDSVTELHGFSDASQTGYAAVVYLRVMSKDGTQCQVSLITAKTKVAPVAKPLSLPRLELCGASLLSKLMRHVMTVLNIDLHRTYAWVDSKVVLAWIKGDPNRWTSYVKNRVIDIRNNLDTHWLYVNTKENPADPASRGLSPSKLKQHELWFNGPEFLHHPDFTIPVENVPETELEKRLLVKCKITTLESDNEILTLLKKYSSLKKLMDVVAYCRRWLKILKNEKKFTKHITCEERDEALILCLKMSQEVEFPEELNNLKDGKPIKKSSRLLPFTPYLDDKGLLRLGGRLKYADMSMEEKHPILITKDNALLPVLLDDAHKNTLHGGPRLMTPYLRSKYWIIKGGSSIKYFYQKCVTCARHNAKANTQLMGNLPEVRVKPSRAFLISGVDFAGPISCRMSKGRGAKTFKSYIALFICMSTKAIHLELVSDMTTEAFIAAFKRFVSRRGHCKELWSDHGTTFIAAEKEFIKMWQQGRNEVPEELLKNLDDKGTRWKYIPPGAPNFGGLWEAGVKSTKYHLKRIMKDSTLTFEEMYTVLTQIEACLNSRPLAPLGDNLDYLTPGHFLVGEPLIALPDRSSEQSAMSSLSRWQLTQRMLRDFWSKWHTEYLSRLQLRPKWNTPQKDLELGELVLIKDARFPPAHWRIEGDDAIRVGPNSGVHLNWCDIMMADERQPTSDYTNVTTYFITFYDEDHNRYLNATNSTEPFQSFILPWWRQVMWIVMFAGMVIVATVGNLVVIWIVLANKRMRSVTHYFLVNLSVADAMVSTLNVIFNFIYMLNSLHWPFGEFYCKFCQFIAVLSISASVFTLMAISIDRYVAIISPLRPRLGKRATLGIAAAIWAGSSLISSPNLVYFTTDMVNLPDGSQRIVCFPKWPDYGIAEVSLYDYYYNVVYMALTYFVPIISMMYTYARVGIELWGSKSIGECTQAQLESVKSKRRVVKMMIVVVVIFAVCWLPFHIYFVVTAYYPELTNQPYIQELYLAIYWLAMSNSMYNPMIYCWMNSKFRRGFKQFFRCCRTLGTSELRRHRAFGADRHERSGRSLSPSRKNGTSTIRISMHSTYNNTMVMST